MKTTTAILLILLFSNAAFSQKKDVYNPLANANADIENAIVTATEEGKHIFLQIGGNWCPWCIKFHNFVEADSEIKAYLETNYKVVKVNYDQKNKNEKLLKKLGFPQRFGFPVFVVLDSKGTRIHTQNSAFLEKDSSYDRERVLKFFKNWSATAVSPESYKK